MMRVAVGTGILATLLAFSISSGPALADELGDRVRGLYRGYEKDDGTPPDSTRLIRAMASKRLSALLAREEACSRKDGPCNLGFDVVVNAQDYQVRKLQVSEADAKGERAFVTARFANFGKAHETLYEFVRESGAWKLDDMEARSPVSAKWRLTKLLAPKGRR